MAAKSSFKNMVICLTVICLVCSSLLAFFNGLTEEPIRVAQAKKTETSLAQVMPAFERTEARNVELDGTEYPCYVATAGDAVVGYAVESSVIGFGGTLKVMVGFDAAGTVWSTMVLSHSETPGLGAKCTEPAFKDQFDRLDPAVKSLQVSKDGGDIDAITASTITSRAYTKAVADACRVYAALSAAPEHQE